MVWFRVTASVLTALFVTISLAPAQQQGPGLPFPRLDTVMPCGAKLGTSVDVAITGADLEETEALLFSHPGIKAVEIKPEPPKVDPKADPKKDPKKAAPPPPPKGPLPPNKFKITVDASVPPGLYDVRAVNKWGISNPRVFCVGDLNEVAEKEPNNDVAEAQRVELNTTITGTISTPTDVDYSIFAGKKGQRILLSCLTSSIDSKAQPMIELFDVSGRRLTSNRNYNGNDALADAILAEDGDYLVRLSEFTYTQGSPLHYYRLSISTAPWIDAVYPPMVEPGKPAQVTLYGRNLPGGVIEPGALIDNRPLEKLVVQVTPSTEPLAPQRIAFTGHIDPRSAAMDGFEYRVKGPAGTSNPVLIAFASAKVVLEKENNDKPDSAEEIPVPCEVAGRIDKRQDRDWYAFNAKKGEIWMIDLWSERLGTPADLYFTFKKDKATTEVEEDDNPEIMHPQQFFSRTSDPKPYRFVAAEDGRYLIGVGSRESNFSYGPRISYRLRVTPEKPDYRLIAMPSSTYQPETTILRTDGQQYLDVFVFRTDGFNGPITLSAEGLPAGVTCPPTLVGSGMKQGTLVLSTAPNAPLYNGVLMIKGTATINGQPVVREARAATITWAVQPQQNIPTIARLDHGLYLAVRADKSHFKVTVEPENAFIKKGDKLALPMLIKQGEKVTVPFKITRGPETKTPITLVQIGMGVPAQQAPVAVNNGQPIAAIAADKNDGTFVIDVKPNAAPGTYAIVLKGTTPIPFVKDPNTKKSQNITVASSTTPIIVQVLPLSVAKVTATPKGNLKPGMPGEIAVKVERQFDYAGDFKVKLVLPMGAKGVTAPDVTIAAGKNEVVLPLTVAADAPATTLQNVVVQATALLEGKVPTLHEAKFNLTVEKAPPPKKEEKKEVKKEEKKDLKKDDKKDVKKDKK